MAGGGGGWDFLNNGRPEQSKMMIYHKSGPLYTYMAPAKQHRKINDSGGTHLLQSQLSTGTE